jgi:integrase
MARPQNLLDRKTMLDLERADPPAIKKKYQDGGGLFLLHMPAGGKLWRLRYSIGGKACELALGTYPEVSLGQARDARDAARRAVAAGADPAVDRRKAKAELAAVRPTFGHYARRLMAELEGGQSNATRLSWNLHLGKYAIGEFDDRLIGEITGPEIKEFLLRWQLAGNIATMHEIRRKMGAVFASAAFEGACQGNPIDNRAMRLRAKTTKSFPAIVKPARFGELLRAIDAYKGTPATVGALRFLALTFQRPHMVRLMRWDQIDWHNKVWEIEAAGMKSADVNARDHMVPLSDQALAVLRAMLPHTGGADAGGKARRYVFAGRKAGKPISPETLNRALREMGFDGEHVSHGFRASANTMLGERLGYGQPVIDVAMAHAIASSVERAYNRAQWLDQRREMFSAWASYLDGLRSTPNLAPVVPIGLAA